MRKIEIEEWALRVIDAVVQQQPSEDDRVELKTDWLPDDYDFARRLAGHANSAHSEPILWLFGVNEKGASVPGVQTRDVASWWQQLRKHFDGESPTPVSINIAYKGVVVVALLVETDRAPFVVKNPQFGTKGVIISHEVPWRESTAIRTAGREHLVRLLLASVKAPPFELRALTACMKKLVGNTKRVELKGAGYLGYLGETRIHVPDHLAKGKVQSASGGEMPIITAKMHPTMRSDRSGNQSISGSGSSSLVSAHPSFVRTDDGVTVLGPGMLMFEAIAEVTKPPDSRGAPPKFDFEDFGSTASITVELRFNILGSDAAIVIHTRLPPSKRGEGDEGAWALRT